MAVFGNRQPQSVNCNTGVQNSGFIGGDVSNIQGPPADERKQLADVDEVLARAVRLIQEDSRDLDAPDECLALIGVARRQIAAPESRTGAVAILRDVSERCGGAPGVASLIASAVSLATALV
ncbi:hypothetical protein [Streptomyces sp. NPDC017868]|uniref:hypothetical protein n=1 Tax=Streptomyces sp. NPDC017868 TaxID=3365014 RepID=UPI00379C8479